MKFFTKKRNVEDSDAYRKGRDDGIFYIVKSNPYKDHTDDWFDYESGWFDGYDERVGRR